MMDMIDGTALDGWPVAPCCLGSDGCVCSDMERALRGHASGRWKFPPMTAAQREACLTEIGKVEGYVRAEHETDDDRQLAQATLNAWTDYARDKGLLD